jgi:hypothetical protein
MRRGAMQPGVDQTDYSVALARCALPLRESIVRLLFHPV